MKTTESWQIWEFDCDDTLIMWDLSAYPGEPILWFKSEMGEPVGVVINTKNVNLLKKLSKIGWYIRVHSGSGYPWAARVVEELQLTPYVNEVCSKPRGRTDDRAAGDGIAYDCYRELEKK